VSGAVTPLRVLGLHHVAICVSDVNAALNFYCEHRGFSPIPRPDLGFPGAWIKRWRLVIHLIGDEWGNESFNWKADWNGTVRLVLIVHELEAAAHFYSNVLGVPLLLDDEWVGADDVLLSLREGGKRKEPGLPISRGPHVAFGVSDIDAAEEWLKRCSVTYFRKTQRGSGIEQIFLVDPDDHTIELNPSPMP
jgi:catechol 2,3-dioxygenase-like lactoylglutathione lyase family enzyme